MTSKPRARELGIPFSGQPGRWNAITDVAGVEVGHTTLIEGASTRTGVTAILPCGRQAGGASVPAAVFSLNGNGELTGSHWIEESGFMAGPVMLTNTHSVGVVRDAVAAWLDKVTPPEEGQGFHLPVVGETYDGVLNDISAQAVRAEHAVAALEQACTGPVAEGNVGGGTGMITHRFKGGIGTASRMLEVAGTVGTLGVLVQSNYGARDMLTIAGVPVGQHLTELMPEIRQQRDGSIIIVVATDLPLLPHQLKRVARRATMGLARLGGAAFNSSGDIFLAFSTARPTRQDGKEQWSALVNDVLDGVFRATVEATEEAIVNALLAAETLQGFQGNVVHALPHDELLAVMRQYGRIG
ncbi:P1 family peptidase [Leeia sp.]|uniref:DmpA family aminopeptidase n=1 Tax=Leeia sp. TaxID=2884678 RepID=UPI0035B36AE7